jgi:hypothetical protein
MGPPPTAIIVKTGLSREAGLFPGDNLAALGLVGPGRVRVSDSDSYGYVGLDESHRFGYYTPAFDFVGL